MNALPDIAGRTLTDVVNWIDRELATRCDDAWERQLPALTDLYARIGEPAYGRFVQQLFAPVTARLEEADLRCVPRLPGTLPLSEEEWGPEDRRERRMWTLLRDDRADVVLGAVVTRFFHDHTRLRLPARPTVVGLPETDHDRIRESVLAGLDRPLPTTGA